MDIFAPIDPHAPGFGDWYDELPLWSAPFGLLLLEHVPLRRGMTVLDVGAGTGFLTVELAQRCGPDSRVIAVDPWEIVMTRLRGKCERLGIENVTLLTQEASTVDLPQASVDLVVSNLGINNFQNAAEVLRLCHRAARPGATLALSTNLVGHMAEFYDCYRETLGQLGLDSQIAGLNAQEEHRATIPGTTELLTSTGFEVERVVEDSFRMRFADGTALLRHYFIRLGFLGGWRGVIPEAETKRVFEALEENLNRRAAREGELGLTIPMACFIARKPPAEREALHEETS